MRKMNIAVGTLVFLGMIFVLLAIILKFSGVNLMAPTLRAAGQYLAVANTCFLMALVIDWFDRRP